MAQIKLENLPKGILVIAGGMVVAAGILGNSDLWIGAATLATMSVVWIVIGGGK